VNRLFLVALGNPGREYYNTRHNIAWLFFDHLLEGKRAGFSPGKGHYYVGRRGPFWYVKPTTYMNNSGIAVMELLRSFRIDPKEELLVLCDDVNLPFGRLRLRMQGSSGGHRGLESIIYHLESQAFPRLRFGVGRAPEVPLRSYVLSSMSQEEIETLRNVFHRAEEGIELYRALGASRAMNVLNTPEEDEERESDPE
jgi:PTH1 family peptidyl-tRNA hydrolase